MHEKMPTDSVGLVTPEKRHIDRPLHLECEQVLTSHDLV